MASCLYRFFVLLDFTRESWMCQPHAQFVVGGKYSGLAWVKAPMIESKDDSSRYPEPIKSSRTSLIIARAWFLLSFVFLFPCLFAGGSIPLPRRRESVTDFISLPTDISVSCRSLLDDVLPFSRVECGTGLRPIIQQHCKLSFATRYLDFGNFSSLLEEGSWRLIA